MQAILFINLETRTDRRDHVLRQIRRSDLNDLSVSRVMAYNGSALPPEELEKMLTPTARSEIAKTMAGGKRQHHSELTLGAVGCAMSHIAAWKHIASMKTNRPVIVFEDDIDIPEQSLHKINTQWQHAKARQENAGKSHLPLMFFLESDCVTHCKKDRNKIYSSKMFYGTRAYAVTPADAQKLLQLSFLPMDVQLDHKIRHLQDAGELYTLAWNHIKTHDFGTNIQTNIRSRAPIDRN
jgi:GR25 family glycosyltransferase involved in LPS biosynthesis